MTGAIESITTGLISLINTDLQTVNTSFKVRAGYPHEEAQIPYSVYVNVIGLTHEEFGLGQKYSNNKIQIRSALVRISVWTSRKADRTLYDDGTGQSTESLYLDRILDRIQRLLITYRNLNMNRVIDARIRGITPLLFDETTNALQKTMSYDIDYEEIV